MQLEDLAQQNERLAADVERLQQVKAQVGACTLARQRQHSA
jgi:hypothetical protein